MTNTEALTGRDLILLRVAHGVRQAEIARAWPCSRSNVARIERSMRPTSGAIVRYMAALADAEAGR